MFFTVGPFESGFSQGPHTVLDDASYYLSIWSSPPYPHPSTINTMLLNMLLILCPGHRMSPEGS